MDRFLRQLTFVLILSCAFEVSFAQQSTPPAAPRTTSTPAKAEKRAQVSFDDELVEGSTQKPELFYLFQKKNFNYKRLIKLRENFLPEMRRTTEDIQRVRGGN